MEVVDDVSSGIKGRVGGWFWGHGWAGSALCIHAVHGDGSLEMMRV